MSKSTCPCEQIYASATSNGSAITISGDIVTANASATASSPVSYVDALSIARKNAQQLANNYAKHDSDVIDQTLTIINSRSLIPSTADITIGSTTSPYSQIYTAKGVVLSSNSPGNEVILTSSKDKLYANGAQVYTSADPQSDASANTFYGTAAGGVSTVGINNSGFGYDALTNNTTGGENTAIGSYSLQSNTTGLSNTAIGNSSLQANTEGTYNTANGRYSLQTNINGSNNTAIGGASLRYNTTGDDNTAVGMQSLYTNTTGFNNTASGSNSLQANTEGSYNTANGAFSLQANTTGIYNTASGYESLNFNTTGSNNTASGYQSLSLNTTGSNNTASGNYSLQANTTGSNNTALGYGAGVVSGDLTNCTSIGYGAICDTSNQIKLGDSSVSVVRSYGAYTFLSDRRDKKDVEDLESSLEFIEQLKPVRFNWNMRDGGKVDIPEIGFIAQDLQQVQQDTGMKIPNLVYDVNPEKLEASYGALVPLLVKSIQEMNAKIHELTAIIQDMKNNK